MGGNSRREYLRAVPFKNVVLLVPLALTFLVRLEAPISNAVKPLSAEGRGYAQPGMRQDRSSLPCEAWAER